MALSAHFYTLAQAEAFNGNAINWASDTINIALVTSSYTPNQDTDQYWSTPQAYETTGTGYTAGGQAITGRSVGAVTGSHEIPLLGSSVSWTSASFTCAYAIIYKVLSTAGTSPLLGYISFGGNEAVSSGTFQITPDSVNGYLSLVAL